jgi:hypothetical protein
VSGSSSRRGCEFRGFEVDVDDEDEDEGTARLGLDLVEVGEEVVRGRSIGSSQTFRMGMAATTIMKGMDTARLARARARGCLCPVLDPE